LSFILYYQQKTDQANKCVNSIQKAPQKELVILRLMGVVLRKGQVGILIVRKGMQWKKTGYIQYTPVT
jgi:hypothetical protein